MFWKVHWFFYPQDMDVFSSAFHYYLSKFSEKHLTSSALICPPNVRRRFPRFEKLFQRVKRTVWAGYEAALVKNIRCHNCEDSDVALLKTLRNSSKFIIKQADKNLGLCILKRDRYISLCEEEIGKMRIISLSLADMEQKIHSCKKSLEEDIIPLCTRRVRFSLNKILDSDWLATQRIPVLYSLIKIHKKQLRGRPIVAAANLPFRTISAYVGWRLNSILRYHFWLKKYLVKDSLDVISALDGKQLPPPHQHYIGVQIDIVELYSSLPTSSRVLALLGRFLSSCRIEDNQELMTFLRFILQHGWFKFKDSFFLQHEGLAMGHPHSPPLANLLVYLLVESRYDNHTHNWKIYKRFLDDALLIIDGTIEELDALFDWMNSLCPELKFTWNACILTENISVEFLDLCLHLDIQNCI